MKILAIESSCDETAAAVLEDKKVLSNVIYSQIDIHREYGGVVPEIASRNHLVKISEVVDRALNEAGCDLERVDAIVVTKGPGLVGALLVGVSYAKSLAFALSKPLIAVNHMKAHMLSPLIGREDLKPPFVCLVVSGGHSYLAHLDEAFNLKVLGSTLDDAVGEAFDKIARTLGFPYPGGPEIDRAAKSGDGGAIKFPRVYLDEGSYDFSFSGLKSSVLNYINSEKMAGREVSANDVAASFQEAAIEVLAEKTVSAAEDLGIVTVLVSGGVAANSRLRAYMDKRAGALNLNVYYPKLEYCSDNAAMIAHAAFFEEAEENYLSLNAYPNLGLK